MSGVHDIYVESNVNVRKGVQWKKSVWISIRVFSIWHWRKRAVCTFEKQLHAWFVFLFFFFIIYKNKEVLQVKYLYMCIDLSFNLTSI